MAVKYITGKDGHSLCGIKVRSGSDRWDDNGNNIYRGSVNNVELVDISFEAQLGMSGILCGRCVKKWKKEKGDCMKILVLNLKKIYFDDIKRGAKPYEFRLDNPYWQKRLQHKDFDTVEFRCGYPKNDDKTRIIRRKWIGFVKMTITHGHFGDEPAEVFAIRTEGKDVL